MKNTYTDDGRKFYTVREAFWNDSVVLTDTLTGFEVTMSKARFERTFKAAQP